MKGKIEKLAELMREVKALIDEIERETEETGISVVNARVDSVDEFPQIHIYTGLSKATNYVPATRSFVECDCGDYWKDEVITNGVKFFEIDAERKEKHNAELAV